MTFDDIYARQNGWKWWHKGDLSHLSDMSDVLKIDGLFFAVCINKAVFLVRRRRRKKTQNMDVQWLCDPRSAVKTLLQNDVHSQRGYSHANSATKRRKRQQSWLLLGFPASRPLDKCCSAPPPSYFSILLSPWLKYDGERWSGVFFVFLRGMVSSSRLRWHDHNRISHWVFIN